MTQIPSKQQIMDWVSEHPDANSKRDIAKAFNIKGAQRIELKRLLKELEAEGRLERRSRHYRNPETLPPVTVVELLPPDGSGDLFVRPLDWQGEGPAPAILYVPARSDPALGRGDRFLARLSPVEGEDHAYQARLMRRIDAAPDRILGIYRAEAEGGRICRSTRDRTRNGGCAPATARTPARASWCRPSGRAPRDAWACRWRASSSGWAIRPNPAPSV